LEVLDQPTNEALEKFRGPYIGSSRDERAHIN